VPTHSRYACNPSSGMNPITKVFVYSNYSRSVSARETDWYRMTSGLSFLCSMALGSFHKLFPKSSGQMCASKSCAVDMQNYPPAFISFILLGKLGTRQLSQTLSGRKCASTSLRQACEIHSPTFDSLLILGKLGTRQLSQTLSSSLGRECASSSLRKLFSFLLLGKLGTRQLSQTLSKSPGRGCASTSLR
jgi:hypothetical protein